MLSDQQRATRAAGNAETLGGGAVGVVLVSLDDVTSVLADDPVLVLLGEGLDEQVTLSLAIESFGAVACDTI